jgi:acyl-CoA thioesterase
MVSETGAGPETGLPAGPDIGADVGGDEDPAAVARRAADAMYAADEASRRLGIRILDVAPGQATAAMSVTAAMINGHDICHGGYVFLLADTAFAFACNSYGQTTVAAACDIVFVAPAMLGDDLIAQASERLRFGRSGVYDITVRRADGTVVAEFRGNSRTVGGPVASEG